MAAQVDCCGTLRPDVPTSLLTLPERDHLHPPPIITTDTTGQSSFTSFVHVVSSICASYIHLMHMPFFTLSTPAFQIPPRPSLLGHILESHLLVPHSVPNCVLFLYSFPSGIGNSPGPIEGSTSTD